MAKAYWVITYRSISDRSALTEYAKRVEPVVRAAGGRSIIRGMPIAVQEAGMFQRTAVVEFENLEKALAAYQNPTYKAALSLIQGKVERDFRIIQGVDSSHD